MIDGVKQAVELERNYAAACLPNGILGLNADLFRDYMQYIASPRTVDARIHHSLLHHTGLQ